jgi:two-component system chemotaxis response regulator CheB
MLYQKTDANANIHPNADVLFRSAAAASCPVVAVVMTGMGSDGMLGAKDLVARKNGHVLVQEPESCIVDGMPASTLNAGLASAVLSPQEIGTRLSRLCASRTLPTFKTSV